MLSYIVAFVACALLLANPIVELFSPESRRPARTARPQLNESLLALPGPNDSSIACPPDAYAVHIYSREPLVVYIENFLTADERSHLLEISEDLFQPSTITHNGGSAHRDAAVRDSHVAMVPRTDPVRCVERRARAFQGWREELWIERLRTQKYTPGGHYSHHYDWSSNAGGWGRVSSMMAWVSTSEDLEGGGTEFPLLPAPARPAEEVVGDGQDAAAAAAAAVVPTAEEKFWCRFLECGEDGRVRTSGEDGLGITFKAVEGNAVFWTNFRADGTGDGFVETWHAGLPVKRGVKVGLNIWTAGRV